MGKSPDMYLVITNIAKRNNIRQLLLSASAFGCRGVFMVGQKKFDTDPDGKDIPRQLRDAVRDGTFPIRRFVLWNDCVTYLRENSIKLVGVEIHEKAKSIEEFFGTENIAFLMGNEGDGLNEKHLRSCDELVRIPQYGGGTASLNVYVAASIVLSRFHIYQRSFPSER